MNKTHTDFFCDGPKPGYMKRVYMNIFVYMSTKAAFNPQNKQI